jgi:hypothetical protein
LIGDCETREPLARDRAHDPVDGQTVTRLKALNGSLRAWSETSIERSWALARPAEPMLQTADSSRTVRPRVAGAVGDQRRPAAERPCGLRSHDSVDRQALAGLEPLDGVLGQGSIEPIGWARALARPDQPMLDGSDTF